MTKIRKNKGFSIAEAVIALTVIVTVTATALTIAFSSVTTKINAANKTHAQCFADNMLECFKAAENEEEFLALASFAEEIELPAGSEDENGNTVYLYTHDNGSFTAEIKLRYATGERDEFYLAITDKKGEEIVSFSYRKGDGT